MHNKRNFEGFAHASQALFYAVLLSKGRQSSASSSATTIIYKWAQISCPQHICEQIYHELAIHAFQNGYANKLPFLAVTEVTDENGLWCSSMLLLVIPLVFDIGTFFSNLLKELWFIRAFIVNDLLTCSFFVVMMIWNLLYFFGIWKEGGETDELWSSPSDKTRRHNLNYYHNVCTIYDCY